MKGLNRGGVSIKLLVKGCYNGDGKSCNFLLVDASFMS